MANERTEIDVALDYVVSTTDGCYNYIYEAAQNLDREQLLDLLNALLLSTKSKDKLIAENVYDSNDTDLAVHMANITQNYTNDIYGATNLLLEDIREKQVKESGVESLPGNIIR